MLVELAEHAERYGAVPKHSKRYDSNLCHSSREFQCGPVPHRFERGGEWLLIYD